MPYPTRVPLLPGLVLLAASLAPAAPVTALKAEARGGQVFLTFQEAAGATGYSVFRSEKPIASLQGLQPAATLSPGSGTDRHTGKGFVIADLGQPLSAGTGLYVHTTRAAGSFHYAVTHPGDAALVPGSNVTETAVAEAVMDPPAAVRIGPAAANAERMMVTPFYAWEDYAAWDHSKGYYGHRFNRAVAPNPSGAAVPLTLVLHAAGSNGYREPDQYFDRAVGVAIFPRDDAFNDGTKDPYTGGNRFHSGWFGHATGGVARNHTERRLVRYLRLALQDASLKIDPARVYARGTSMGGGGSLHLAWHHPHLFAAVAPTIGWIDPDSWSRGIWVKAFGAPEARMPVNAPGGPSWWDWQNMATLADTWPGTLPPVVHTFRKDDDIISMATYPGLLEKSEARGRTFIARWQDGGHRGFSLDGAADFLRFRRDEAHPAFADATSSDAFAAQEGQRNLHLDWSSRHHDLFPGTEADAIADSLSGLALTLKSLAAEATVTVTPRNAQRFHPLPGDTVRWTSRAHSGGALLDSGTTVASAEGLVSARLKVTTAGNRLDFRCGACAAPARQALLKAFTLPALNPLPVGVVDHARKAITVTVPADADLAAVRPEILHTGTAVAPASGEAVDLSKPGVSLKVTGGGREAVYTVEVKRAAVGVRRAPRAQDGRKSTLPPRMPTQPPVRGSFLLGPDAEGTFYTPSGRAQAPALPGGFRSVPRAP